MKRSVILFSVMLLLNPISETYSQDFSNKEKMIIYSECQKLLSEYTDLINKLSELNEEEFNSAISTGEDFIELFINRKVLIYNDLDPLHSLSEYYELETYTSNLVMWYPDGMNVKFNMQNIKTSKIRKHDEGLFSTDIMVDKIINGNYLNKSTNKNTEELIFRIAFTERNNRYKDFKIAGIRSSKSADIMSESKDIYKLISIDISENNLEKIKNNIIQLLNDYQRSLAMLGNPEEPEEEKEFYKEAFIQLFNNPGVKIFNDIEKNPESSIITVKEYVTNYLNYYQKGIRNLALNSDSATFEDIVPIDENKLFCYVYADKYFSGKFQNKDIYKLSSNLVFKITFKKEQNTFTNFKIESIDKSGVDFYEATSRDDKIKMPADNIINISRRGFNYSVFLTTGYSSVLNYNIKELNVTNNYHEWKIMNSLGYGAGIAFNYFFDDNISINTGVAYENHQTIYSINGSFEDPDIRYDINYEPYYKRSYSNVDSVINISLINIPLLINYVTSNPNKKGFYVKAGLNSIIFINGKYNFKGDQYCWGYYPTHPAPADSILIPEFGFYEKNSHNGTAELKTFSVSGTFGAGFIIPIHYFREIYFGPVITIGLLNVSVNNDDYADIFGKTYKHKPTKINYFGFELGIRYY